MKYHYKAFISYKHDPTDSRIAAEIQTRLERFHIPSSLQKELKIKNLRPVFRDKNELSATDDLNDTIKEVLLSTEYLIVICSTRSIRSVWVAREIEFFLEHHDKNKVLTVLVDGEPEEVIPRVLCEKEVTVVDTEGSQVKVKQPLEPLSCDYRMELRRARREELPRLAAALIGCRYNDLRQRQRQYQMRLMGIGFAVLSLLTVYFIWSNLQISANLRQAKINQSRQLASLSSGRLEENDRLMAVRLALEALPGEGRDRPVIYESAYALSQAEGAYNYPDGGDIELQTFFPARYGAYAFRTSPDMQYMVMLDSRYLLRFFDLQEGKEIGEAELDRNGIFIENVDFNRGAQLSVLNSNILLVSEGNRLSAWSMETAELLWSQYYEDEIFAVSVLGRQNEENADIALVFADHVLVVGSENREIRGRFDSGNADIPFAYRTDQPFTVSYYSYGEDENGKSLFFDQDERKLYIVSRSGSEYTDRAVTGVLMIDAEELRSEFCPIPADCCSLLAFRADKEGFWFAAAMNYEDYPLNSYGVDSSFRPDYDFRFAGVLTVLHADTEGTIRWERKVPFDGTTMLGNVRLIRYSGSEFEDCGGSWVLGTVVSDQVTFMDPEDGTALAACRAESEIVDLTVSDDETSVLAYTLDGWSSVLSPEKSSVSGFCAFPDNMRRGMMRTPEWEDDRNCFLVMHQDGVRLYFMNEGDQEYSLFSGETAGFENITESMAGKNYCICNIGGTEIAVLDLEKKTVGVLGASDLGMKRGLSLLALDPEEKKLIITGKGEEEEMLAVIRLGDLDHELIGDPGLYGGTEELRFRSDLTCGGNRISYFGVRDTAAGNGSFCLLTYDIAAGEWSRQDLDFDMLDLLLKPSLTPDGSQVLMIDQWENGYLIGTDDGNITQMEDKIPAWESVCWKEDGTSFALIRKNAEKEQIAVFDADGRESFRIGRDFVEPLSFCFHGRSLWVCYEDQLVCEYDARTGKQLRSISADTAVLVTGENIRWDFTEDGELILNMGCAAAQIDPELNGMTAEIRNAAVYAPAQDCILVRYKSERGGTAFAMYRRYTVEDLIRKGQELTEKMELTESQKREYALE